MAEALAPDRSGHAGSVNLGERRIVDERSIEPVVWLLLLQAAEETKE